MFIPYLWQKIKMFRKKTGQKLLVKGNNDLKDKEIRLLKKQIKQSEEVIHDMDKNN